MEPNVFKITNLKRCNTFIQITKLIFYNVVCCLAWFLFRVWGVVSPWGFAWVRWVGWEDGVLCDPPGRLYGGACHH